MTRALTENELVALDRAAAVGFRRDTAAVPEVVRRGDAMESQATAIAFASHQRRLTALPPRTPAGIEPLVAPSDPRPVLPASARSALTRLCLAARMQKDLEVLLPVGWVLRDRGWRLHPFDTEILTIPALQEAVGPYEHWLAIGAGLLLREATTAPDVPDTEWTALTPAARVAWLERRRMADPDVARALLETVFPTEKAEVRQRLLGALRVRLAEADRPFLESLSADRSAKVREIATELRSRLAERDLETVRRTVLDAVELRRSFLGFGARKLHVRTGVDVHRLFVAIASHPADRVLGWLGLHVDALLACGEEAVPLWPAFGLGALGAGDVGLHQRLLRAALETPWDPLRSPYPWLEVVGDLPHETRRSALDPLLETTRILDTVFADRPTAERWLALLEGPLTAAASRRLVTSRGFAALLGRLRVKDNPTQADRDAAAEAEAVTRALSALIHPADARIAAEALGAVGPQALPLVRQTWNLLALFNEGV